MVMILLTVRATIMVNHWAGLSIFLGPLGTVPHKCLRAENKININEIKININEIKIDING